MSGEDRGKQGGLLIEPGTLWDRLRERTSRALESGSLQPIPTGHDFVEEGGVRFLVRILSSLVRKDEERWRREKEASKDGREVNPFLPYDEELYVAELTDSHICLLNKFNVVEHHLLIVTRRFEDQEIYLTEADFAAMLAGLAEYDGLAFYNGGTVAGASQRHKHLQLVPLPLAPEGPKVPVQPVLDTVRFERETGRSELFPFVHAVTAVDRRWLGRPFEAAALALRRYHDMLRATGMESDYPAEGGRQSGPYNLLATRDWMLLVPRSREFFDGASVNALGFAGSLLVRNEREMENLRRAGPMTALRGVALAAGALRPGMAG